MGFNIVWITTDRFDLKPDISTWIEMSKALIECGHNVKILAGKSNSNNDAKKNYSEFTIYLKALDYPFIYRITLLFKMLLWIRKNSSKNDVILINDDALPLVPLLRMLGYKNIHLDIRTLPVDLHTIKNHLNRLLFWTLPMKFFSRFARSYSFITDRLRIEIEKEFQLNISDYAIWQSGVSTDVFYPKNNIEHSTNGLNIFYHGTISVNRGIGLVIQAMALCEPSLNVKFTIIGDGSGASELKQLTADLGLEDRVFFKGFLPYEVIVDEIAKADICICPLTDRLEWNVSSPIKVFEYMACSKPMILTPIPAHLDVVEQAPFVVWTKGYEPEDFHEAIIEAIDNKEQLKAAAKSAIDIVKNNYEWRSQANKLAGHLMKTIVSQ